MDIGEPFRLSKQQSDGLYVFGKITLGATEGINL